MLTTPDTIRTLQRKLYAKAKQETVFCYALNVRVCRRDILSRAGKHGTGKCACLGTKNIGKPCAGKLHARFDEGGQAQACSLLYPLFFLIFRISCSSFVRLISHPLRGTMTTGQITNSQHCH